MHICGPKPPCISVLLNLRDLVRKACPEASGYFQSSLDLALSRSTNSTAIVAYVLFGLIQKYQKDQGAFNSPILSGFVAVDPNRGKMGSDRNAPILVSSPLVCQVRVCNIFRGGPLAFESAPRCSGMGMVRRLEGQQAGPLRKKPEKAVLLQ